MAAESSTPPAWSVGTLWSRFAEHRKNKAVEVGDGKFVYLILEDLTHGLSRPHILDLKMGTQQYGEHESTEKKLSKKIRVESTTSGSLGTRVGGLQVWDSEEQAYVLKDKYWGRSLDEKGLYNALCLFVSEQETRKIRTQVVKDIITQLDRLERAVKSTAWRFYGCSVLIVYDGATAGTLGPAAAAAADGADPAAQAALGPLALSLAQGAHDDFRKLELINTAHMDLAGLDLPSGTPGAQLFADSHPAMRAMFRSRSVRSRSQSFDQYMTESNSAQLSFSSPRALAHRPFAASVRLIDLTKTERNKTGATYDTGLVFGIANLRKLFAKILLDAPCAQLIKRRESSSAIVS